MGLNKDFNSIYGYFVHVTTSLSGKGRSTAWFLFALVFWRVIANLLEPLKPLPRILVSVALSAAGGYMPLGEITFNINIGVWHLGRAVAMLPVYIVGQELPFDQINHSIPMGLARNALGAMLIFALYSLQNSEQGQTFMREIPFQGWSHLSGRLEQCDFLEVSLFFLRGMFRNLLESTKSLLVILMVCPQGQGRLQIWGRNSLQVYLLHRVPSELLMRIVGVDLYRASLHQVPYRLPYSIVPELALVCCFMLLACVLASTPVSFALGWILNPVWLETRALKSV